MRIVCLMLCLLVPLGLSAQSGQGARVYSALLVSAETGKGLEGVICEAQSEAGKTIGYSFSDRSGTFRLSSRAEVKRFRFRMMGYKPSLVSAQELEGDKLTTIRLSPSTEQLREVVVSAQPIRQRGDTIRYQVSSFKTEGDRYIGDILRKLPGIQVDANGKISYQGEPINKFYVEGRDLMGGQYGLVTNNLTADAVSNVEVLERNQHIKALKQISRPGQAAINIKLKRSFTLKPFGELGLASGLGDKTLYKGQGTLANFSRALQLMVNLKGNNTGEHLLHELEGKMNLRDLRDQAQLPSLISQIAGQSLPLPSERYTIGKSYIASGRALIPLTAERELKLNFSHGKDDERQEYQSLEEYYLGDSYLSIDERTRYWSDSYRTDLGLSYEENSSSKYITSEFSYKGHRDYTASHVEERGYKELGQGRRGETLQGRSRLLLRSEANRVIDLGLSASYSKSRENLGYQEPEQAEGRRLSEGFEQELLRIGLSGSSSLPLGSGHLGLEGETSYRYHSLSGTLTHSGSPLWQGLALQPHSSLRAHQLELSLSPYYRYRLLSGRLELKWALDLSYQRYWLPRLRGKEEGRINLAPSLSVDYKLNSRLSLSARAGGGELSYRELTSLLPSPYLRGYRTLYRPTGELLRQRSYRASTHLKYQDLFKLIFANLNLLYRYSKHSHTPEYQYTADLATSSFRDEPSSSAMVLVRGELSKGFNRGRTMLNLTPSLTQSSQSFIQQGQLYKSRGQLLSSAIELTQRIGGVHQIGYKLEGQMSRSRSARYHTPWLRSLRQSLSLSLFPLEAVELKGVLSHQLLERRDKGYDSFLFADLSARYKAKGWELELIGRNLFGETHYSRRSYSSLNVFTESTPLRGREVLLAFKFNF